MQRLVTSDEEAGPLLPIDPPGGQETADPVAEVLEPPGEFQGLVTESVQG